MYGFVQKIPSYMYITSLPYRNKYNVHVMINTN